MDHQPPNWIEKYGHSEIINGVLFLGGEDDIPQQADCANGDQRNAGDEHKETFSFHNRPPESR